MRARRPPPNRYYGRELGEWIGVVIWVVGWLWVACIVAAPLVVVAHCAAHVLGFE